MADAFESEQEQLESIKAWWKENGRVVTVGLVLGLGGVFGWQGWQTHLRSQAEQASVFYEEMVNWASTGNYTRSNEYAETLMQDFSDSGYAALGGLVRASNAYVEDRPDEARGYLEWVVGNTPRTELQTLARLRIARIAAEKQEYDTALEVLQQTGDPGHFRSAYEEVRGDILAAQDDPARAASHYENALKAERLTDSSRRRIQMKLDALGIPAPE